jgi:acyl transferase domain-containing protein
VRRASINNFGFGGSNAHIIIDDAVSYLNSHNLHHSQKPTNAESSISHLGKDEKTRLFVLSAFDEAAGKRQVEILSRYLEEQRNDTREDLLDDLAFTLGERRSKLPCRAAVPAASLSQLIDSLDSNSVKFSKAPKTVALGFVFTGQGAQWHAMGRELLSAYPVFRDSLGLADKYVRGFGASWSLIGKFSLLQSVCHVGRKSH